MKKIANQSKKMRFIAVGVTNTAIDFGLLFIFKAMGLPTISANIASTTCAFIFSFFANKKFTFKSDSTKVHRELTLFILVTLFGLWVVQSVIIFLISPAINSILHDDQWTTLAAKLAASVVTMIWNYLMYDRVVFKRPTDIPPVV